MKKRRKRKKKRKRKRKRKRKIHAAAERTKAGLKTLLSIVGPRFAYVRCPLRYAA